MAGNLGSGRDIGKRTRVIACARGDDPAVVARVSDLVATTTNVGDVINRPTHSEDDADAYTELTDPAPSE